MQANIAWAYAVLLHSPGPELLDALAREAEKKLAEFTSQNISNLVYAFAKLEHVPAGFLQRASQAARTLLGQFTPQVDSPYHPLSASQYRSHMQWDCSLLWLHAPLWSTLPVLSCKALGRRAGERSLVPCWDLCKAARCCAGAIEHSVGVLKAGGAGRRAVWCHCQGSYGEASQVQCPEHCQHGEEDASHRPSTDILSRETTGGHKLCFAGVFHRKWVSQHPPSALQAWGFANILFEPGEEFWQLVGQNAIWHIHDYSAQNIANGKGFYL